MSNESGSQPYSPPTQGYPAQPQQPGNPGYPPAGSNTTAGWGGGQPTDPARHNPFAGIPVSDYVRDGAALLLLLLSLAMPWNYSSAATGRVEVILITLLSVFSLAVTYLARVGVLPASLGARQVAAIRLAANIPYFVLALVYVVIDAVGGANNFASGGVGHALAFGLTGALLAAQPRKAEVAGLPRGAAMSEAWYRVVVGFGVAAGLLFVANLILILTRGDLSFFGPAAVAALIAQILFNAAAVVLLYLGVIRRSAVGRLVALAIGILVLAALLIDTLAGRTITVGGVESLHSVGYGAFLLCALAALAGAPAVEIAMNDAPPIRQWFGAASVLLVVCVAVAGFIVLLTIFQLVSSQPNGDFVGFGIGTIVTLVAFALVALVARTMFRSNPATSHLQVLGLVGVLLVLGIVHIVLGVAGLRVGVTDLVLALGLPLAIAVFLTVPKPVRDYFQSVAPQPAATAYAEPSSGQAHGAPIPGAAPAPQAPSPAPAAQPAPAAFAAPPPPPPAPTAEAGFTVAQAQSPSTPPETLFAIAQAAPTLRPYLAANPATYPDLLNWLAGLGDERVNAALRARGQ
jgi:hypothetical protein